MKHIYLKLSQVWLEKVMALNVLKSSWTQILLKGHSTFGNRSNKKYDILYTI